MKRLIALGLALAAPAFANLAFAQAPTIDESKDIATNNAVLRALDKVAARVQTFNVPVGQPVTFGRLEILVKSCFTRPPEETPENTALLFITKLNAKGQKTTVFDGWMFGSSPGLSAMDDPVYDIWVIECENKTASNSR